MRLLYWYTRFLDENGNPQKYHGLDEFELNLSTDTKYHFDANTSVFTQEPYKTPLPEKFWGDKPLYNINVIVGQNGDGKTTVVHTVMDTLQELYKRELKDSNETVFLAECNEKHVLFYLTGSQNKHKKINGIIEQIVFHKGKISTHEEYLQYIDGTKLIYIANTLSEEDDIRYKKSNSLHDSLQFIYDCSLCATMRYDVLKNYNHESLRESIAGLTPFEKDPIRAYFSIMNYKQLEFVADSRQLKYLFHLHKRNLSVPAPKQVLITIHKIIFEYKSRELFIKHIKKQKRDSDKIAYRLCTNCFYSFLWDFRYSGYLGMEHTFDIAKIPKFATYEEFKKLFESVNYNNCQNKYLELIYYQKHKYLDLVKFICDEKSKKHFEVFNLTPKSLEEIENGLDATLSVTLNEDAIAWLVEIKKQHDIPFFAGMSIFSFDWGLSSGEENLLRFFSSLYYAFDKNKKHLYNNTIKCNSVIILMDEADLTYHPEWQRQLIQILAAFLPLEFGNCGIDDLQVILTTHSPLLLGDIPSNNVTYLRKGNGKMGDENFNTFGQNIHTIFKESFFLDSTIGAFATDKINKTAKKLRDMRDKDNVSQNELRECKAIIDLLAPGVIKSKLIELYEETTAKRVDKNKISMEQFVKELSPDELANLFDVLNEEKKRRDNDKN